MQNKWYILFAISVLTVLGFHQEPNPVANQEIVIQFSGEAVGTDATHQTIATITQELESLGIDNVSVAISDSGTVIISYYSTLASQFVKNSLSFSNAQEGIFELAANTSSSTPGEWPQQELTIDVFDIQEDGVSKGKLDGHLVTFESKFHRSTPTNFFCYKAFKKEETAIVIQVITFKKYCLFSMEWQQPLYVIPEVRAGPASFESIS